MFLSHATQIWTVQSVRDNHYTGKHYIDKSATYFVNKLQFEAFNDFSLEFCWFRLLHRDMAEFGDVSLAGFTQLWVEPIV